jgi:hypothetical protein
MSKSLSDARIAGLCSILAHVNGMKILQNDIKSDPFDQSMSLDDETFVPFERIHRRISVVDIIVPLVSFGS